MLKPGPHSGGTRRADNLSVLALRKKPHSSITDSGLHVQSMYGSSRPHSHAACCCVEKKRKGRFWKTKKHLNYVWAPSENYLGKKSNCGMYEDMNKYGITTHIYINDLISNKNVRHVRETPLCFLLRELNFDWHSISIIMTSTNTHGTTLKVTC